MITKDEYDEWRYNYPGATQGCAGAFWNRIILKNEKILVY